MKRILLYIIVALSIMLMLIGNMLEKERKENKRLEQNQESLFSDVKHYKTEAGDWAASVMMLKLSKEEVENHCDYLNKTIKELNLKLKRVQSAATTSTKTDVEINVPVRDSIVYRDRIDTIKCIEYIDPWIKLKGCFNDKRFSGTIHATDTITQIVHRVPKKFLFIKYGTKAIRQEVVSKNPHTKIVFTEYIRLE